MFKFLKSKKGFTLVELMIVVVIMAILVAVAVPIYAAVTSNAKKKTCIGNQREIVSSIGNAVMLSGAAFAEADKATKGTITITTDDTGDNATWDLTKWESSAADLADDKIVKLFKTTPFCPEAENVITITVTSASGGENTNVVTSCKDTTHKLETNKGTGSSTD